MKAVKICAIVFAIIAVAAFTKKQYDEKIWIEQTTFDKAIDFEKSISNKAAFLNMNVSLSSSVYPLINTYAIAKPIIVQREQTGLLPLYAEYFYSKSDSVIRYISYDWEKEQYSNFSIKQEMWKGESKKLDLYNKEYERIKSALINQLGKPTIEDTAPKKVKSTSGNGNYLTREAVWETEGYYSKVDMVFASMTYRIRWTYYWKK